MRSGRQRRLSLTRSRTLIPSAWFASSATWLGTFKRSSAVSSTVMTRSELGTRSSNALSSVVLPADVDPLRTML
ncbi:hypothetical protein G6F31_021606 [Rhizopus arrhizus]|nr:hypothetical protein G6F31_021606 [Rhizopus arrhizus]